MKYFYIFILHLVLSISTISQECISTRYITENSIQIRDITTDFNNDIYFTDEAGFYIYKIDSSTELISIFAGTGIRGDSGDAGLAKNAQIGPSRSIAIGPDGNLYFSDWWHNKIRKIDLNTNIISTYAGTGNLGYTGDGAQAVNADLNFPIGIDFNNQGDLYIADSNNNVLRRVNQDGIIETVVPLGEFVLPQDIVSDHNQNIIVMDGVNKQIKLFDTALNTVTEIAGNGNSSSGGDGGLAINAGIATFGSTMLIDTDGNLIFTQSFLNVIRKIDFVSGIIETIAGTGLEGLCGDGFLATQAVLGDPYGLTLNNDGDILFAQRRSNGIRIIGTNYCQPNLNLQSQVFLNSNQYTDLDIVSDVDIVSKQIIGNPNVDLNVSYKSESNIILIESFEVDIGDTFHAFIGRCQN